MIKINWSSLITDVNNGYNIPDNPHGYYKLQ